MTLWVFLVLFLNGIISFVYGLQTAQNTTNLWAMLAVNFVFFLGITQTGIIFSAVMRISRSQWARPLSRIGEILTLSFIPVAAIVFIILYAGGVDHLFYWALPQSGHGHHLSPWLGKKPFLWRNIVTITLFYVMGYIYFRSVRKEEGELSPMDGREYGSNVLAALLITSYVIENTNIAWDFGMMIIPHWESSIFPPYFWSGNLMAGSAFLFLIYTCFVSGRAGVETMDKELLDSTGKLLLGFTLLWVYMFWSQYVVIWYGNLPEVTGPLFKKMSGNFAPAFTAMMLTGFVLPFLALIFRRIKLRTIAMSAVALSICTAMWIDRYLMIIPVVTDGSTTVFASWTGISLILSGLASTVLSLVVFLRFFPKERRETKLFGGFMKN